MPIYDIICPGCAESYHETTETYDPDVDANAGMLKLKDQYKSYGWNEPPPDPTCGYGVLECPECEAPLAPSGRFKVREKEPQAKSGINLDGLEADTKEIWICSYCQKECKSKAGLVAHMRRCKLKPETPPLLTHMRVHKK